MQLRYLHGESMTVHFGDEKTGVIEHTVHFTPTGDVPEAFVDRLLKKHPNDYKVVEAPKVDAPKVAEAVGVKCDLCDKPFKNEQGLIIHKKRMHKETQ